MRNAGLPNREQLMATSARVLFDQGNINAVVFLLDCEIELDWAEDEGAIVITFLGDYLTIKDFIAETKATKGYEGPLYKSLEEAFDLVLPLGMYVRHISCRVKPVTIEGDWRAELLAAIRGEDVHNQAANAEAKIQVWEGLRFRSQSEVKIAQALERAEVLFFPNCRSRLGLQGKRQNREADFLVCQKGKWGILEVDGEPYHPASRATQDHARDRLFKHHGIVLIEHYDAQDCYNRPDAVVREFLDTLAKLPLG